MKKLTYISAFFTGFNSIIVQALLIRELLVNFIGNELSMGIILAAWLFGGALGSIGLARNIIDKIKNTKKFFIITFSFFTAAMAITIFLSRTFTAFLNIPKYEIIAPGKMLIICLSLISPVSMLMSLMFITCCKMLKDITGKDKVPAKVYMNEAAGAASGGLIFTLLLIKFLPCFYIIFLLMYLNIAFILINSASLKKIGHAVFILILLVLIPILCYGGFKIEKISQQLQWHDQNLITYRNSPYGNIAVVKDNNDLMYFENGSLLFSSQDEAFNEEFIHLSMLQHPAPKDILLIGSGMGGIIRQILQHNPEKITYLEIDPLTIEISKKILPKDDIRSLDDPRVKIVNQDARLFINNTKENFDIIIVNLPDPTTIRLNRFYTKEFYNKALRILKDKGVLITKLFSNESAIRDELALYNASALKTIENCFNFVSIIPGEKILFICSKGSHILNNSSEILVNRFKQRKLNTVFFTTYHIRDKHNLEILEYVKKRIDSKKIDAQINTDFKPVCFFYDTVLWGIRVNPAMKKFYNWLASIKFDYLILSVIFIFFIGLLIIKKKQAASINYIIPLAVSSIGAISILLEITILLSFQANYGFIYEKAALLIALFMFGMSLGSYIVNILITKFHNRAHLMQLIVIYYSLFILSVPFIISLYNHLLLYLLMLMAGTGAGCLFPISVYILRRDNTYAYSSAVVWGADLFGATLGVLIFSIVIIPIFGIFQSIYVAGFLAAAIFILLTLSLQKLQH